MKGRGPFTEPAKGNPGTNAMPEGASIEVLMRQGELEQKRDTASEAWLKAPK